MAKTQGDNDHLTQRGGGESTNAGSAKFKVPQMLPTEKGRPSGDNVLKDPISAKD